MDIDVRKLMLTLLERQKEYVCEDLENYSCAMVATFTADGRSYLQFPKFEDEATKIAEYSAIVERAKADGTILLVTVNNALTQKSGPSSDWEEYRWGDFTKENASPCILVTASGPGLESCSLELCYRIESSDVQFGVETELSKVEVNLLPDWPGELPVKPN
jgi:hypothetical protein